MRSDKKRKRSSDENRTESDASTRPRNKAAASQETKRTETANKRLRVSEDGEGKPGTAGGDGVVDDAAGRQKKASRFIVFIGNLPYTATKAAVEKHLSAASPAAVRLMSMKDDPSRCKGFAFVEFARYDQMELCLTKFHHSTFHDGISEARKINVELTAGGGGKSKARRQKLSVKNEKLNEERKRLAADRAKKERPAKADDGDTTVHPSRRHRVR